MSQSIDTSGPAFPMCMPTSIGTGVVYGMTLRDYFAAKTMQSLASDNYLDRSKPHNQKNIAELAYQMADAMLKARES